MMSITGDNYFNMKYFNDNSFKEAVRLKMLNQEDTFRKQVQELHRLYQMQIMLTENSQLKGVLTKQSMNCPFQGTLQRHLEANVSDGFSTKYFGQHSLNIRDSRGTRENPVQVEYYHPGDTESSLDYVGLSLGIGEETKQRSRHRKSWHQNLTSASSQEIIDLEESSCTELSGDIKPILELGCIAGSADSRDLCSYRSKCISTNYGRKNLARGVKRSLSFVDECKTHLEKNSNEGAELFNVSVVASLEPEHCMPIARKRLGELQGVGISPVTKVFTSHEALCLDLNKPLPDESLFDHKDLPMDYSGGSCSGVTERVAVDFHKGGSPDATSGSVPGNNCFNKVSAITGQNTLNIKMATSNSNDSSMGIEGGKALSPDPESSLRPSDCCSIHHYLPENSHHKDADLLGSNFTGRCDKCQRAVVVNDDIIDNKNAVFMDLCRANPVEDLNSSPASCKSDNMTIDRSGSLKTMQSGIYLGKFDLSHIESSPNSESSHNESSSPDKWKSGSFDGKEKGSAPDDFLVQSGAVALMYLFLESSKRVDCIAKFDEMSEIGKGKKDQPQYSTDTFESMVLKQQESNIEDYCVTSSPPEVISTDKKDFGVKVRRGRRMKDFQKDILPSLASLSRHEISEDIQIMEAVMRSREYKRLQSKKCSAQKWFAPVKNKRSRLNYVGRKHYTLTHQLDRK